MEVQEIHINSIKDKQNRIETGKGDLGSFIFAYRMVLHTSESIETLTRHTILVRSKKILRVKNYFCFMVGETNEIINLYG